MELRCHQCCDTCLGVLGDRACSAEQIEVAGTVAGECRGGAPKTPELQRIGCQSKHIRNASTHYNRQFAEDAAVSKVSDVLVKFSDQVNGAIITVRPSSRTQSKLFASTKPATMS